MGEMAHRVFQTYIPILTARLNTLLDITAGNLTPWLDGAVMSYVAYTVGARHLLPPPRALQALRGDIP